MNAIPVVGSSAREIARSIEAAITNQAVAPGQQLPTVRALAAELNVSPATVIAAYRGLRERGLITGSARAGTRVADQTVALSRRLAGPVPAGVRNLADGNPDPALLPALQPKLAALSGRHWLYGESGQVPALIDWARHDLTADGLIADHLLVVGGALDGVERALQAHLRPGDAVAVEDPGYGGVLDLVPALKLRAIPVAVDTHGMSSDALARALQKRPKACVLTPRAHNPTGAALNGQRAEQLTEMLAHHPDVLVIEDDHAGAISGAPAVSVVANGMLERWVVIRSLTKTLGPDMRVAIMAGDRLTVNLIERRQQAGAGWVSHLLQELAASLLTDPATSKLIDTARDTYRRRRRFLTEALTARGIDITGYSGFNMWIPVRAEGTISSSLLARGWAVRAGESFRLASPPGLRVTIATLQQTEAQGFAAALESCLHGSSGAPTA